MYVTVYTKMTGGKQRMFYKKMCRVTMISSGENPKKEKECQFEIDALKHFPEHHLDLRPIRTKCLASLFLMRTSTGCNRRHVFPDSYNLGPYKARVSKHLLDIRVTSSLNCILRALWPHWYPPMFAHWMQLHAVAYNINVLFIFVMLPVCIA